MTSRFKKIAAGLALAGFLFTGALAGVGYSQARAVTTSIGTVTIRSIISGSLSMANGVTFGWADALFSRDASGKVALKTNSAQTAELRTYYGTTANYADWQLDSSNNLNAKVTELTPGAPSAALNVTSGQNCTAGAHLFKITFITAGGETDAGAASGSVTCDGTHTTVALTSIPTGSLLVTGRNIYATKAGGSTYFLVSTSPVINDNSTTSNTFNIADGSFTATTAPTANTAVDTRAQVNNLTGFTLKAGGGSQAYRLIGKLFWEAPASATPASTNYAFSSTYVLPANTFGTVGDQLEVEGLILLDANTSNLTYQCNIGFSATGVGGFTGGTSYISSTTATATGTIRFHGFLSMLSTSSVSYVASNDVKGSFQETSYGTASVTTTSNQNMACGVTDAGSHASRGIIEQVWITYVPK